MTKQNLAGKIVNSLNRFVNIFGYSFKLNKLPKGVSYTPFNNLHEPVSPMETYAPWKKDTLFLKTYEIIKANTLVDKYRCYELWQLVEQSKKIEGAILEVGVWKGGTAALIANKAKIEGIQDKVFLCDTFKGVVMAKKGKDSFYKDGEHKDTSKKEVEDLLKKFKINNTKILQGTFPTETAKKITSKIFRFCHIDVDVYESAKMTTEWIWSKLSVGGIIVYDDYGFKSCDGVTKFVNEQRAKTDRIIIHNLNGHAIIIKIRN